MPVKFDLRWHPKTRRWEKMVNGKRYVVSCRQLIKGGYLPPAVPETKEHTRDAANRWLKDQLSMIPQSYVERQIEWAKRNRPELIPTIEPVPEDRLDPVARKLLPVAQMLGINFDGVDAETINWAIGDERIWRDRFEVSPSTPEETLDRSVQENKKRFLSLAKSRFNQGGISASEYSLIVLCLEKFTDWLGEGNDVQIITPDKWESWHMHILDSSYSFSYKSKLKRHSKEFVQYLAEKSLITLPGNLASRKHRLPAPTVNIETFTAKQVKEILSVVHGRLRLIVLLALNVGLTQKDVTDLTPEEYQDGQIIRYRSKTKQSGGLVRCPLWDETRALLDHYGLPFLTAQGKPWTSRTPKGRTDNAHRLWLKLLDKLTFDGSLTMLRATSSTLIGNSDDFSNLAWYWLGHSPRTVETRNYVDVRPERVAKAVAWLGQQYGIQF